MTGFLSHLDILAYRWKSQGVDVQHYYFYFLYIIQHIHVTRHMRASYCIYSILYIFVMHIALYLYKWLADNNSGSSGYKFPIPKYLLMHCMCTEYNY